MRRKARPNQEPYEGIRMNGIRRQSTYCKKKKKSKSKTSLQNFTAFCVLERIWKFKPLGKFDFKTFIIQTVYLYEFIRNVDFEVHWSIQITQKASKPLHEQKRW